MKPIYINPLLLPFLEGLHRFNVAYGGRSSGKSWGISDILLLKAMTEKDILILCVKGTMVSIKHSVKSLIEKQIKRHGWEKYFYITKMEIVCTLTGAKFIFGGLSNPEDLKSIEEVKYLWIEEANVGVTQEAIDVLIPTMRVPGNRLFFTFNPKHKIDPVYDMFIENTKRNSLCVEINYLDNPFCSKETLDEIAEMLEKNIEKYNHIYLGKLATDYEGSLFKYEYYKYFDVDLEDLESTVIAIDPSGGDGEKADEAGIVVAGKIADNGYILDDKSDKMTPYQTCKEAVRLYYEYEADFIVIEKNGVGAGFKTIVNLIDKNVPVKEVHAKKGKKIRAKPVSFLYESGRIYHKKVFSEMEFEMSSYSNDSKTSPNRLDACVYAIMHLLLKKGVNNNNMKKANKSNMRGM